MFSKIRNVTLALTAVAALGTATLVTATTPADAMRGGIHGGFRGNVGMRMASPRMVSPRLVSPRLVSPRIGNRVLIGNRVRVGIHRPILRPNWCHRWHHRCRIHVRWPRPIVVGALAATSYAVAPSVAVAPRPCTCLTKEYTPDNLVVFKDVCTKEVASAPIGNTQVQLPVQQQQQEQAPAQN